MGVIVNKENSKNDDLSRRISADLRARAMDNSGTGSKFEKDPDFAEDAEYLKDLKKTGRFGWVWIVLIVLAILALIVIII